MVRCVRVCARVARGGDGLCCSARAEFDSESRSRSPLDGFARSSSTSRDLCGGDVAATLGRHMKEKKCEGRRLWLRVYERRTRVSPGRFWRVAEFIHCYYSNIARCRLIIARSWCWSPSRKSLANGLGPSLGVRSSARIFAAHAGSCEHGSRPRVARASMANPRPFPCCRPRTIRGSPRGVPPMAVLDADDFRAFACSQTGHRSERDECEVRASPMPGPESWQRAGSPRALRA